MALHQPAWIHHQLTVPPCTNTVVTGSGRDTGSHDYCSCSSANHPNIHATTVTDSKDDQSLDTLLEFINGPEEENQKISSRAANRQRKTQCKQVNSENYVEDEGDSNNKQHDLSSTAIQEENKKSKSTKKPYQLSDNEAAENQQQKEDIELDSSDDETEKERSQGRSDHSSDDLDLAAEMMMHHSSSQEFKLATSGNKFDKQQERNQGGKQITNDVQFNSSSSPTNNSSNGTAKNQSHNQKAPQKQTQQPQ